MKPANAIAAVVVIVLVGVAAFYAGAYFSMGKSSTTTGTGTGGVIQVVAAENFWGSLVSQLGGTRTNVVSIITDPNVDPHEYESNPQNAVAVANAQLIIQNGVGYDDWMTKLIAANNFNPNQKILNVANLLGVSEDDPSYGANASVMFSNEHFWYNPVFVNKTVNAMYRDLVGIDPSDTPYFQQNYKTLNASLYSYMKIEAEIKARFAGTHVAATETIFLYMANATGLDVVTPFSFMKAVAEGNDPSPQDVATFQTQLQTQGYVKELVYNNQTVSPLTNSMYVLAQQHNIPIAKISETLAPVGLTFQQWMTTELNGILSGLEQSQ